MIFRCIFVSLLLLASSRLGADTTTMQQTHVFSRGQVWTFRLDPTEPPATLTILRVESLPKLGEVVHISVSAIRMPTGITSVGHLPMSKAALDRSVIALQRTEMGIPNLVGYEAWKSAKGGVFTTSVNEALAFVREAMQRGK